MRKSLTALFKWPRYGPQSPWAAANRKNPWSPLAQELIGLHIADASSGRARKGWAEATRLRPDWRIVS